MFDFLTDWITGVWDDFVQFMEELFINAGRLFLEAIASLVGLIPVPAFISSGLGSLLGAVPTDVIYFLSMTGFDTGLLLVGAGVAFRLTRKIVTLGIW